MSDKETAERTAMEELSRAYDNPHLTAQAHHEKDLPVFGYFTEHVPVELLYAAGILPVKIQGGSSSDLSSMHLQSFTCAFSRVAIHRAMKGEYDYLEGIIAARTCDVGLSLFQIWNDNRPSAFSWLLSLPGNCDEGAVAYFKEELGQLRKALETHCNRTIPDKKIVDAVTLYNDLRNIISRLWQMRNKGTIDLSAEELIKALRGCQVLPPDTALDLLGKLIEERTLKEKKHQNGVRLIVTGNVFADASFAGLVERSGGNVIFDDTSAVGRDWGEAVNMNGDALGALAKHYVCKITGCFRLPYEERWAHIQDLIRKWNIDGCIDVVQKYCDTSLFETPLLVESLKQAGIPCLSLELDDTSPAWGQVETRVQAFVEMFGEF